MIKVTWGNGFILSPRQLCSPSWRESVANNHVTHRVSKERVKPKRCFVHQYSLGCQQLIGTTCIGGLPISINGIRIIPPTLISEVRLDSVRLTTSFLLSKVNTSAFINTVGSNVTIQSLDQTILCHIPVNGKFKFPL